MMQLLHVATTPFHLDWHAMMLLVPRTISSRFEQALVAQTRSSAKVLQTQIVHYQNLANGNPLRFTHFASALKVSAYSLMNRSVRAYVRESSSIS